MTTVERAGALALVVLLALLLGLWGAFLVPLSAGGVPVPVAPLLALVANLVLGTAGGRLYGRLGAAAPALVWFAVALPLQTRRAEGDVVVTGTLTGVAFLLLGALGAAVALGLTPPARSRT